MAVSSACGFLAGALLTLLCGMEPALASSELFLQKVLSDTDGFGVGVAADDTMVAVGAWLSSSDMPNQGKVKTYTCDMTDCEPQVTLFSPVPQPYEYFGSALALKHGLLVVGAPGHDLTLQDEDVMEDVGAAYVFSCAIDGEFKDDGCTLVPGGMLFPMAIAVESKAFFGSAVAINGELVVVGAPMNMQTSVNSQSMEDSGSVFVYQCTHDGCSFIEQLMPKMPQAFSHFGTSITIDDNAMIIVGSPGSEAEGTTSGLVYIFVCSLEKKDCIQLTSFPPPDGLDGDLFGNRVAVEGGLLAVSAKMADSAEAEDTGAVYMFRCAHYRQCDLLGKYVGTDSEPMDNFGSWVSVQGTTVAIGAERRNKNAVVTDSGAVFIYDCDDTECAETRIICPDDAGQGGHFGSNLVLDVNKMVVAANNIEDPDIVPLGRKLKEAGSGDVYYYTTFASATQVKSDPHFAGLQGQEFDFDGVAGGKYILLDAPLESYQILVRLGDAYTTGFTTSASGELLPYKVKGTWLSALLFKMAVNEQFVSVYLSAAKCTSCPLSAYEFGTILVNKTENAAGPSIADIKADVLSDKTIRVTLASDPIKFAVHIVPPPSAWRVKESAMGTMAHLNLDVQYLSTADDSSLGGLLGITARGLIPTEETMEDFAADKYVDLTTLAQLQ